MAIPFFSDISGQGATFSGDVDLTAGQLELRGDVALDHDGSSLYVKAPSSIFLYPGNTNKGNINAAGLLTVTSLSTGAATFSGVLSLPDGSAGAPSVSNTGDANTGMYWPGDHQLGFTVNNSRKMYMSETKTFFQNQADGVEINNGLNVQSGGIKLEGSSLQSFQDFQSKPIDTDSGLFTVGGHGMALGYTRAVSLWSTTDGVYRSWVGTNLRWDGTNYKRASNHENNNWGNIAGMLFWGNNASSGKAIEFIIDPPENASGTGEATIGTTLPSGYTALTLNNDLSATFAGSVNVKTDKVQIDQDGTYGSGYGTIGFGGTSNGYNRVFGATANGDGLFLASATGRGVFIRVNGGSTDTHSFGSNGYVGMGIASNNNQRLTLAQADANGSHLKMNNSRSGGGYWVVGVGDTNSNSSIVDPGGLFFYNGSTKLKLDSSGNATFSGEISQIYNPGNTGAFQYLKNANAGSAAYVSKKWQNNDSGFGEIWRNSSTRTSTGQAASSFNMYNSADINFWSGGTHTLELSGNNASFSGTISSGQVTATVSSGANFEARKGDGTGAVGFGGTAHQTGLIEGVDGGGLKLYTAGNNVNWGGAWALNTTWSGQNMTVAGTVTATHFYGDGSNLTGVTVSNADTVDNLHAASFLRSDATDTFTNLVGQSLEFDKLVYDWTAAGVHPIIELKGATSYGIFYHEGSPDAMKFSTSGNTNYELAFSSSGITHKGNSIWHAANDGSGSGLDADLLDGMDSTRFISGTGTIGTTQYTVSNWNSPTKSGWYSDDGASNKWSTANWSSIMHVKLYDSNNLYASQLGFDTYNNNVYARTNNAGTWTSWDKIWHAGVDGSGSGLDADLLDGQHGSYYAPASGGNYVPSGGSWGASNMPGSRHTGISVNGGEVAFLRDNPNNAQMSVLADGAFYAGENNGFYSLYSGNSYNSKSGFYADTSGHLQFSGQEYAQLNTQHGYIQLGPMNTSYAHIYTNIAGGFYFNKTALSANGNTMWHAGNDGSGSTLDADLLDGQHGSYYYPASNPNGYTNDQTAAEILTAIKTVDGTGSGLDADTLDGLHLSNIDNAEGYKTWAVSASGGQAVRHTIGRLYGTSAHWDSNWQNIEIHITSEYYEATTLKYRLTGNYNGAGGQAGMFRLHLLDADGDLVNNINLILGTVTDAGWDHSSADVYYMDLYADVRYYSQFKIHAKTFAHGYATSNPTSGGWHTIFYASPATANISDFSVNHQYPVFRGNKLWHAGIDGSGSGLDADTVDGIQGSAIITTSNIASQNVNSADKIDGINFLNTNSNSGVNADTIAQNGHTYYTSGVTNFSGNSTDGGLYSQIYSSSWQHQIAGDYRSGQIAVRGKNNGTWQSWYKVWSANNDGAGSGLDADTLDGQQASAFQAAGSYLTAETNSFLGDGGVASTHPGSSRLIYSGQVSAGTDAIGMPTSNNANAFINLNKHPGEYNSQLGFSSNGHIYYRNFNNTAINSTAAWRTVWDSGTDGSGTGLDADTVDGLQAANLLRSDADDSYDGNLSVNDMTFKSDSNVDRNFKIQPTATSTDVGLSMYTGAGNHAVQLYGVSTQYGFLDGNWAGWDIRKTKDGALHIDEGSGLNRVISLGSDGSGCGFDADLLDGSHGSAYALKSGSNSFTNSYNEFGNNTGAVSNDGTWDGRVNISGTNHARLDLFEDGDDSKLRLYVHVGNNARIDTTSATALQFGTAATPRMTIPANSGVVTTTGQGTLWGSGNDGSGTGLDADLLDGYHRTQVGTFQSSSDFADGTLVSTSIVSSNTNGDSFVIEISGKAYGSSRPHKVIAEGYIYNNTIINTNGSNLGGTNFTYLKVMNNGGTLAFWWPRHGYWNSYDVYVRTANTSSGGANHNKVTAIANSTDPSSATKKIQINLGMTWTSHTDGAGSGLDADTVDGLQVHTGTNNAANQIVRTDGNGYANFGWINTVSGNLGTSVPDRIYSSNDGYIRYLDLASFRSVMNVTAKTGYQGREQSTTDTNYWIGSLGWGTIDFNTIAHYGSGSIDSWSNPGNQPSGTSHWVGSQHLHYANGSNSWYGQQIVVGAGDPSLMYVRGAWGGTPTSWRKMWNAGNDGSGSTLDADLLDGFDTSQSGGASKVLVTGSNSYLTLNNWMHVASAGIYSSVNGAHLYPNQQSDYGAWRIQGTRNGWSGITFLGGETTLMANTSTMGFYNDADNEWMVEAARNGHVRFYYDGAQKAMTVSSGVEVTGTLNASAKVVAGASGSGDVYVGNNATGNFARFHTNNSNTYFDMNCGVVYWRQGSNTRFQHNMTSGTFTSSADVIAYGSPSDVRLKENIKPIESALDKAMKLQGVTFDWKKSDSILNIKEDVGFIAQDVQKVVPELVRENEDGMLSMRHQGIAPILLEAIKELKAEIEELKKQIK